MMSFFGKAISLLGSQQLKWVLAKGSDTGFVCLAEGIACRQFRYLGEWGNGCCVVCEAVVGDDSPWKNTLFLNMAGNRGGELAIVDILSQLTRGCCESHLSRELSEEQVVSNQGAG